jgi:hypothetical protein
MADTSVQELRMMFESIGIDGRRRRIGANFSGGQEFAGPDNNVLISPSHRVHIGAKFGWAQDAG